MIGIGGLNVDFRWPRGSPGYPAVEKLLRDGVHIVRCISLPEMEDGAAEYMAHGIRVIACYTGESDQNGRYVMRSASALQIGNEPQYCYPKGAASWPTGTSDDMINVWNEVANVLVPRAHPEGLPLIGPGFWAQDFFPWSKIAGWLPNLSAAAVHCYPEPSGQTKAALVSALSKFKGVRPDVPLICTEWHATRDVLAYARAIDTFAETKLWYGPSDGLQLEGTAAYGILALTRS